MATPKPFPDSITKTEHAEYDTYQGLAAELIECGIVRADQLPGLPGHGKTAVTFWQGRAMARGERAKRDETFLNVWGSGSFLSVSVGLSPAVLSARAAASREKQAQETAGKPMEYTDSWWGENITGKKAELQAMGIGAGLLFPGEEGGPQRAFTTLDPRGLKVQISTSYDGRYTAKIHFADRPESPHWSGGERKPFAPEVLKREGTYSDCYYGSAEALVAAGLAQLHQLPGQPGCTRKVSSTVFPDGSMPKGACTATYSQGRQPGAKNIKRASKSNYEISVVLSDEVQERRKHGSKLADAAFTEKMEALPRPPRLPVPAGMHVKQARTQQPADPVDVAKRALREMADSEEDFLSDVVSDLRGWIAHRCKVHGLASELHGYAIDEGSIMTINMAFDAIAEAVMQAGVTFDKVKHQEIAGKYMAEIAKHDASFQSKLFKLTLPTLELVEGEAP